MHANVAGFFESMKFGLVNGKRVIAKPHVKGVVCPKCHTELIAKCGEIRVHHWAHKNKLQCDDWIEEDNEWRSRWLDAFPEDWQEPVIERNGESHFADIQTPQNTIILLHQSHLTADIIQSRENFYQSPVWIINAGRYRNDVSRFLKSFEKAWIRGARSSLEKTDFKVISEFNIGKVFRKEYLQARSPVFFDYTTAEADKVHGYGYMLDYIWCLMPYYVNSFRLLYRYRREELIKKLENRKALNLYEMKQMGAFFKEKYRHII